MTTDTLTKATDTTTVVVSAGITQDAHRHSDDDVNHNEDSLWESVTLEIILPTNLKFILNGEHPTQHVYAFVIHLI